MKTDRSVFFFIIILAASLTACSHIPRPHGHHITYTGTASWYGSAFHGRPTASGEIYNMYKPSAAHKTLPLGTEVRVTNLSNNKKVIVTINDRGPFVGDRIIDMSYGAAKRLGMVDTGLAKVEIEVLKTPHGETSTFYSLQFGAFCEPINASSMMKKLEAKGYNPSMEKTELRGQDCFRVRLGRFSSLQKAKGVSQGFAMAGMPCIVIGL
ncbi:MAG: septal ring lytic transglycosylase RlpA family protein [Thermodesulfobacteriota bacterium]|nr:septal ring lytic transglycosylase RlpA family protein [Thermodesulfobacteriota bacterium]